MGGGGVGGCFGGDQGSAPAAMPLGGSFNEFISAASDHCSCVSVLLQLIVSYTPQHNVGLPLLKCCVKVFSCLGTEQA